MRWTYIILLAALHTALPAAAYPPYRSRYDEAHPEPVEPFIPPSPYYRPPTPPRRSDSYHAPYAPPRPRRDSSASRRPRRNSYVPAPPPPPFPHLPHPPPHLDAFGRPLPHPRTRHDSLSAPFPKHPARSGTIDPAHLPHGFQWHADQHVTPFPAHAQHPPFGALPAPFQPSSHGHVAVHPSFAPPATAHRPFNPHAPHPEVNPFLPPGHPGHGAPPAHPGHGAHPVAPSSRVHPAIGHPLYEKYGNPNYGLPADAHIDAYKRPPHARIDPYIAKEPYEGNPLGLTMPGMWGHERPGDTHGHPSSSGSQSHREGSSSSSRRHTTDYKGKKPIRH